MSRRERLSPPTPEEEEEDADDNNYIRRLLTGDVALVAGSAVLLLAKEASVWENVDHDGDYNDYYDDEDEYIQFDDGETAATGTALCLTVLILSSLSYAASSRAILRRRGGEEGARAVVVVARDDLARWNRRDRLLLLAPSLALFALLVWRLFAGASVFDGSPRALDFGWKYGLLPHGRAAYDDDDDEGDGDALYNDPAEKSVAFVVEFNSYGHAAQGFLSSFLSFAVVSDFLVVATCRLAGASSWWWPNGTGRIARTILVVSPYASALYPTYGLVKRYAKASEAFAGSSFANNSFEWASGFVVGLAAGNFLASVATAMSSSSSRRSATIAPATSYRAHDGDGDAKSSPWRKFWDTPAAYDDDDESRRQQWTTTTTRIEEDDDVEQPVGDCANASQILLGAIHWTTVFAAAYLFGVTWRGCLEGSPDACVNAAASSSDDDEGDTTTATGVLITSLAIPSFFFVGATAQYYFREPA